MGWRDLPWAERKAYLAWTNMRRRYRHWPPWERFEEFRHDVGLPPSTEHRLSLRNARKGYKPPNVFWGDGSQSLRGSPRRVWVTYNGETRTLQEWKKLGICRVTCDRARVRISHGWDPVEAIRTLPGKKVRRLTDDDVAAARAALAAGLTQGKIAQRLGCSQTLISAIKRNKLHRIDRLELLRERHKRIGTRLPGNPSKTSPRAEIPQ